MQARLFRLSWRNALLAYLQYPNGRWLRTSDDWKQDGFTVENGESAIWIWEPIIKKSCPVCDNSLEYHDRPHVDCTNHQTGHPEYWPEGVVGTKPTPYFDISQVRAVSTNEQTYPHELLSRASPSALSTLIEALISEDGYALETTLPHAAEFDGGGQIHRNVMTFQPEIEVLSCNPQQQAPYLIKYHLLAKAHEESGTPSSQEREIATWAAAALSSYFPLDDDELTLQPGRLGDSKDDVEAALTDISTAIEKYRKRLRRLAIKRRNRLSR
jgi:hypothetical protein